MRLGFEHGLADRREQIAEPGLAGGVEPEDERVREKADLAFELHAMPVRDRRAHEQLALARVAAEQDRETGEERHEEGRPVLPAERLQPLEQLGRQDF